MYKVMKGGKRNKEDMFGKADRVRLGRSGVVRLERGEYIPSL